MSFVLADQQGWLNEAKAPFDVEVVGDFAALRAGVNEQKKADFFMWERKRFLVRVLRRCSDYDQTLQRKSTTIMASSSESAKSIPRGQAG